MPIIALPFLFYLIYLGFQIADRGLDAFERRNWVSGCGLLILGSVLAIGNAVLLPWLIFGSGLFLGQ